MPIAQLTDRAVVAISGADRVPFLQGLVSNDVAALGSASPAAWTALLTPQGKWLADFFVLAGEGRLLLDCEAGRAAFLAERLGRFRLRSNVALEQVPELSVLAGWGEAAPPAGAVADPRLPEAGWRALIPGEEIAADATDADYDLHRLRLGLPSGSRDLDAEKSVLLEAGFDELNGVSWSKGCYMGQELTARTKYRGLVKRRLVPVAVQGPLPERGTPVLRNGAEVGEMRSGRASGDEALGLALLRLDALGPDPLVCGEALLRPRVPAWMRLPADASG